MTYIRLKNPIFEFLFSIIEEMRKPTAYRDFTFTILKFIKVEMLDSLTSLPLCFTMADANLLLPPFFPGRIDIVAQRGFGAKTELT